jgi:hypothetical protein
MFRIRLMHPPKTTLLNLALERRIIVMTNGVSERNVIPKSPREVTGLAGISHESKFEVVFFRSG